MLGGASSTHVHRVSLSLANQSAGGNEALICINALTHARATNDAEYCDHSFLCLWWFAVAKVIVIIIIIIIMVDMW